MPTPRPFDGHALRWNNDRILVQVQLEDSSDSPEKRIAKNSTQHISSTTMRRSSVQVPIWISLALLFSEWTACDAFAPVVPRTNARHWPSSPRTARFMVPQAEAYTLDQTTKEETLKEAYDLRVGERSTFRHSFAVTKTPVLSQEESSSSSESSSNESSDNKTTAKRQSSAEDNTEASSSESDGTTAEAVRSRQVALYRSGLLRKGSKTSNHAAERKTSVGDRRVGSATQARRGIRRTTQLTDAVKQRAQGISGARPKPPKDQGGEKPQDKKTKAQLATSLIQSTVEEMLRKKTSAPKMSQSDRFTAAISSWGKSMGILGDEANPRQGQILSESPSLVVRVATPMDDVDIANLRLSVFSDFSPEMRSQFCLRSCQALAHRRSSGAICVVAKPQAHHARSILLGSAECSFHEFRTTRLGQYRRKGAMLYITEVAVHPSVRRQGIGRKLLEAMDAIASKKGVETLYLHVDVSNDSAMGLYEKCGYQRTNDQDPVFQEFTTSLNLHPGATRGRTHYLLYKNIRVPTWLEEKDFTMEETKVVGSLGFEIPA